MNHPTWAEYSREDHMASRPPNHGCVYGNWLACEMADAARGVLTATGRCGVCLGFSPPWDGHYVNPPCIGGAHVLLELAVARWDGRKVRYSRGKVEDVPVTV